MSEQRPFDVFLAHNSEDKPQILKIYQSLKQRGIKPWLDVEEIIPGSSFQDEIQEAISLVKTAAIFFGPSIGSWQAWEVRALFNQCVKRNIRVIPVLLPGVEEIPQSFLFLRELHAVTFECDVTDDKGLFQLEWGITGQKPSPQTAHKLQTELIFQSRHPESSASPSAEGSETTTLAKRYADLEKFLKAQKWKKADKETYRLMITKVGKEKGDYLRTSDLKNYPCDDLRVIDQLWVQHSQGLFGFSVQKKIWEECGSPQCYSQAWEIFGERVGWRADGQWLTYDSLNPSPSSPFGNFPSGKRAEEFSSLASRLVDCKSERFHKFIKFLF